MAINTVTGSGTGTTLLGPATGKKARKKAGKGLFRPGKGGEIAAQQHPDNYFATQANAGGMGPGSGSAAYQDWFKNSAFDSSYGTGYQQALAQNEKLMYRDWLKQAAGQNLGAQLQQGFTDFSSDNDPQGYYASQLAAMGLTGPHATGGSSPDAIASYNNAYNGYYADWLNKNVGQPGQGGNPSYHFDEYLAGHDAAAPEIFTGQPATPYIRDKRHGKPPKKKGNGAGGTTAGSVL